MSLSNGREAEELLLRLSEFGAFMTKKLADVAGDELVVQNVSITVLCRLDLNGPLRPNEIADLEDMTTGGVSKLLDRLESGGLIERKRGVLATDKRAVLVVITPKGRSLARRMGEVIAERLIETEVIVKELNRLLDPTE